MMVIGSVMFGEVILFVVGARSPVDFKLVLFDSILDPVETHVHRFGFALSDLFVGETMGGGVVNLGWCGRLRIAHFL
jgi:hypothetical protein